MDDDIEPPVYEVVERPEVPRYVERMSEVMATVLLVALFAGALTIIGKLIYELIV